MITYFGYGLPEKNPVTTTFLGAKAKKRNDLAASNLSNPSEFSLSKVISQLLPVALFEGGPSQFPLLMLRYEFSRRREYRQILMGGRPVHPSWPVPSRQDAESIAFLWGIVDPLQPDVTVPPAGGGLRFPHSRASPSTTVTDWPPISDSPSSDSTRTCTRPSRPISFPCEAM
jgi:hypothetical protein